MPISPASSAAAVTPAAAYSLDALLQGAKASLARANTLTAARDADAAKMASPPEDTGFVSDLAHGVTEQPLATLKGFLQGAKEPAVRVAKRLGENAMDVGNMLTDPGGVRAATAFGNDIGPKLAFGQLHAPSSSDVVKAVTGVDPTSAAPEMAADALTSLLFLHGAGVHGGDYELGRAGIPHNAVEPSFGPSPNHPDVAGLRMPQAEGPIALSKAPAGRADRLPIATDPTPGRTRSAEIPSIGDFNGAAEAHEPYPVDRYLPNRSAASYEPDVTAPADAAVPTAATGKPRVSASEFADILRGRDKFASVNPDAELPPGGRDELDRMGLEYGRTQGSLKELLGMPNADPAEVSRMRQGARELGSRLRNQSKAYATPPAAPEPPAASAGPQSLAEMLQASLDAQDAAKASRQAQPAPPNTRPGHFTLPEATVPDDVYEKIRAEKGIAPTPDERAGRVTEAGGTSTPEPALSDRFTREFNPSDDVAHSGLLRGEEGSVDPALLANLLRIPAGAAAGAYFDPENRERGAVMGGALAGTTMLPGAAKMLERARYFSMLTGPAQLKNIAGDIGVVGHAAAERAMTHGPGEGLNVLKQFLSPETAHDYKGILTGSEVPLARMDQPTSTSDRGITGLPFRMMGAADEATKNAMTRAGVDDAAGRTFTAEPKSDLGKAAIAFQRKGGSLARLILPFAKTAVNQAEGGIMPLADLLHLKDLSPERQKQVLAKVALLGASGAAGAAYGTTDFAHDHPALAPFAAIGTGPGALEFAVAQQFAKALHEGKSSPQALNQAGTELRQQMPTPSEWAFNPSSIVASLVPTGLRTLNTDPVTRDTSQSLFGPLLARIPFLSRTLPAKGSAPKPKHSLLNE